MNCKFTNVLVFAAGAAIGSVATWFIAKTRYERIVQEEVDAFKETYVECMENLQEQFDNNATEDECEDEEDESDRPNQIDWDELEDLDEEELDEDEEESDSDEYDSNDYARLVNDYTNQKGGAENMAKDPYVISPYDFGEIDDYNQIELTYYADGTLEDDEYNVVTDVDELIGPKALTTFGEYEDDSVFVRNERLCTDFQILKDYRTYAEARSIGPDRVGDE